MKEKIRSFYGGANRSALVFQFIARIFITACIFISIFVFKSAQKAGESAALLACSFLFEGYFLLSKKSLSAKSASFECAFIAFLLLAGILGSVFSFFEKFASYDIFTHSLSGILCVEFVFLVSSAFAQKKDTDFSSFALFSFCFIFTAAVAALWEVWEFIAFTLIKYVRADSFARLFAQFGFGAEPVFKSAAPESAAVISERYDTFSDIICALFSGSVYALVKIDRKKHI